MTYSRAILCIGLLCFLTVSAVAQKKDDGRIGISGNRVSISHGGADPIGFGLTVDYNKFISNKLNVTLEYRMSHARKKPYFIGSFHEKSFHYLEPKLLYYPFRSLQNQLWRKIVGGFNLGVGPSLCYGTISEERSWVSYLDNQGVEVDRESRLEFDEISKLGFVIKLGYEKAITRRMYAGGRMDFAGYNNDDGYIGLGLILGVNL